jgi:hypothetical protein
MQQAEERVDPLVLERLLDRVVLRQERLRSPFEVRAGNGVVEDVLVHPRHLGPLVDVENRGLERAVFDNGRAGRAGQTGRRRAIHNAGMATAAGPRGARHEDRSGDRSRDQGTEQ